MLWPCQAGASAPPIDLPRSLLFPFQVLPASFEYPHIAHIFYKSPVAFHPQFLFPTTPVIIIDEANYINNAILNDLKILFNFEMDCRDRAAILLAGLPKLNSTLGLGIHEPLKQRIVMNYNLEGLTKEEGHNYITEKLKGAGCNQTVFEDAAMEAILNAADGTPRMINKYCNQSMLIGDSNKANLITTDIVMQAINDCELG